MMVGVSFSFFDVCVACWGVSRGEGVDVGMWSGKERYEGGGEMVVGKRMVCVLIANGTVYSKPVLYHHN